MQHDMKFFLIFLLFCTTAFAKEQKTFKFENYLSWKGKFNQKQAEEDFARFYPKGTDIEVILEGLRKGGMKCGKFKEGYGIWDPIKKTHIESEREREREYFCSKYLRSARGLFTKSDYCFVHIILDKNKKLLDFKIDHYNNAFVI